MVRQKLSRRDALIQSMLGLDQSAQNDLQLASMAEELVGRQSMRPFQEEGAQLANELMRQQVAEGPAQSRAKLKNFELQSIGDLAQGLYGAPEGQDIIMSLLESGGHYRPDPRKALERKAAQHGMTVEQLEAQLKALPTSK